MKNWIIAVCLAMLVALVSVLYIDPLWAMRAKAWAHDREAVSYMAKNALFENDIEEFDYWMRFRPQITPDNIHTYDEKTQKIMKTLWKIEDSFHEK